MSGLSASFPENIRRGYYVHKWSENQTFLALSFLVKRKPQMKFIIYFSQLEPELQSIKEDFSKLFYIILKEKKS